MAQLIDNGDVCELHPKDKVFSLSEMQSIVGGYIEILYLADGKIMVINEEGKLHGLAKNDKATELAFGYDNYDYIAGPALVCEEDEEGDLY